MTEIALVLLILGFLFATLQYPTLMKRFWKWFLISVGSLALAIAATVVVVVEREAKQKEEANWWRNAPLVKSQDRMQNDPFAHLMPGYNAPQDRPPPPSNVVAKTIPSHLENQVPAKASPYDAFSSPVEPTGKGDVFDQFDTPQKTAASNWWEKDRLAGSAPNPANRQDSLEERVDEALRRAAMPGKN